MDIEFHVLVFYTRNSSKSIILSYTFLIRLYARDEEIYLLQ